MNIKINKESVKAGFSGIKSVLKNYWWQITIIILAIGVAFSGYKCTVGNKHFEKEGIHFMGDKTRL